MKKLIAYCGLDCEKCDARKVTLHNDNALREKVAKLWSGLNGMEIMPEMINCKGCRLDGIKSPYCNAMCPIRQCALGKDIETYGKCYAMDDCQTIGILFAYNAEVLCNLKISKSNGRSKC